MIQVEKRMICHSDLKITTMMNKAYKIHRIRERGYKIVIINKKIRSTYIRATKGDKVIYGTINKVFKTIFGY